MILKKTVGVHDGSFHADEISACGLLIHFGLVDQEKVLRTRDLQKLQACEFVCDVGGYMTRIKKGLITIKLTTKGNLVALVWFFFI
jgi:uncharacterized UPF0160 family protein